MELSTSPHAVYEKVALASGGLLATALAFLTENTVHHLWRTAAVALLLAATLLAGAGWLTTRGDYYSDRHPWVLRLAILLLGAAFTVATIGYGVAVREGRSKARASQAPFSAPDESPRTAETNRDDEIPGRRRIPSQIVPPPERPRNVGSWVIVAAILGAGGFVAFASGTRTGRVVGVGLGVASIVLSGWKLLEFDSIFKKLELRLAYYARTAPAPPNDKGKPNADFILLAHKQIGTFPPGKAILDTALKSQVHEARGVAESKGNVRMAILVGHVDKRALLPDTAREYASNQGLAIQRALSVQAEISGIPCVVTAGGPAHTNSLVTPDDLAQDRRVDIYFFGRQ